MGRPQPMPTSCVSVTAKNTAHQLPEPCSPGKFLPDQEMPDSGDHVCAAPWPWASLALLHSLKVRDTLSLGIGRLGEMCLLGQLMRD